jgi:hypothetical protein
MYARPELGFLYKANLLPFVLDFDFRPYFLLYLSAFILNEIK